VSLIDIFPTVIDLAGATSLAPIDGHSLVPLMQSPGTSRPSPVAMSWKEGNHSLRDSRWRYTRYRDGSEELYDHVTDPYEWTNLALDQAFDDVRTAFSEGLTRAVSARS
jgi:arylsulfatase A-like enzyme